MSAEPLAVVFALLDARRRQSIEDVAALLHPDVVHEGFTDELVCQGRDEVLHNVRRSFVRQDDQGLDHLELVAAGPDAAILGLSGPRFRDAPWAGHGNAVFILHKVKDGLVVHMRDFLDRAAAFRAAGADPVDWV